MYIYIYIYNIHKTFLGLIIVSYLVNPVRTRSPTTTLGSELQKKRRDVNALGLRKYLSIRSEKKRKKK